MIKYQRSLHTSFKNPVFKRIKISIRDLFRLNACSFQSWYKIFCISRYLYFYYFIALWYVYFSFQNIRFYYAYVCMHACVHTYDTHVHAHTHTHAIYIFNINVYITSCKILRSYFPTILSIIFYLHFSWSFNTSC